MSRKHYFREAVAGAGVNAGKGLSRGKNAESMPGLPAIKPTRTRLEELRSFMENTARRYGFPLPVGDGSEELFDSSIDPE